MIKSIIRIVVIAGIVTAVFFGCAQVSDATGGRVDEFLTSLDTDAAPDIPLTGISVAYNQKTIVYPYTPLNDLKAGLTVTAKYVNGTTKNVPATEYQMSGTLVVGTSTITVIYKDQTATFTVSVTLPDIPNAPLVGISAVYDSTEAVYVGTTLDDLKDNLIVTANYGDGTTRLLGASEYELSGTPAYPSSVITIIYENWTASFLVTMKLRDVAANLYAKAPPILPSDSPIDLSLTSGTNILDKAFNYANANPGNYTFALESDIELIGGGLLGSYTAKLTQPGVKLTIVGLGAERKIRALTENALNMTIELGGAAANNASGLELTLGDNAALFGWRVIVYTGALIMQGNAKVADGSGVLVRDSGSFIMRDDATVYGNTYMVAGGGGVTVLYGGTFIMEGNASVYNNIAPTTTTSDVAGGVYVRGAGENTSFIMRDNASVRGNNGSGVYIENGAITDLILGRPNTTVFTLQGNAAIYDNIGYGVCVKSGKVVMEGNASIHENSKSGIYASSSSLIMSDHASVYGNKNNGNGGGVYMSSNTSGSFTLTSSFTMGGNASIYGNTVGGELYGMSISGNGGGVYMAGGSEFTMSGSALIYGNTAIGASGSGGGVYVGNNSEFTMSGGTIYGLNAPSDTFKNTAGQSGAALFAYSNAKTVKYGDGGIIVGAGSGVDLTINGK